MMRNNKSGFAWIAAGALLCAMLGLSGVTYAAEVAFNAGVFDITDGDDDSLEGGIEFRGGAFDNGIIPVLGFMGNGDGASYGYLGIRYDIPIGDSNWIFTPGFAPGLWSQGDSKGLGHEIEFRTNFELAYRFIGGSRLGLAIYHLSNADLSATNPGQESLILTWAIPLGGR